MKRDWLNCSLAKGVKVRITIPTWLGAREGVLTGDNRGRDAFRRWTIELPHSRLRARTYMVSCAEHEFEVIP